MGTTEHVFGGSWTEQKLTCLRKYLEAYRNIFTSNPRAKTLRTAYVDAFAGTGTRRDAGEVVKDGHGMWDDASNDADAEAYRRGSVRIALELDSLFDRYLLIERDASKVAELRALVRRYPIANRVRVWQDDANSSLQRWCAEVDWRGRRAVVFLDPYGMQVEWQTIEAIARTQAIDLWLLFPLGQSVNRLLTKAGPPTGPWADRLTATFGTPDWRSAFYRKTRERTLFDQVSGEEKVASFDSIAAFFNDRLRRVFAAVVDRPLLLRNSKNVPLFMLCFAAGNPRGARTAVRIASSILEREERHG